MKELSAIPTPNGPDGIVLGVIDTLKKEEAELISLAAHFTCQLTAIREQKPEAHEQAMYKASETLRTLEQLRSQRERQMRLLRRVLHMKDEDASLQEVAVAVDSHPHTGPLGADLLEARAALREQANKTRSICEQLDFALHYAVGLGREMLQAMQDLGGPPPCVYTAQGHTSRAAVPRSLVNRVG